MKVAFDQVAVKRLRYCEVADGKNFLSLSLSQSQCKGLLSMALLVLSAF